MNKRIKDLAKKADEYEKNLGKGIGMSRDEKFVELVLQDAFSIIKEACIGGEEETQIGEIIDERLQDAASDVVDTYGIVSRIY